MRITSQMMVTNSLRRLSSRLEQYEASQEQLATGRRINRTSDDPSGASKALGLRAALRARTQEERNGNDAMTYLDSADSGLQDVVTVVQRVRDLTIAAANDLDDTERRAIATEVRELQAQIQAIANSRVNGRPLFSGTLDGDAVTGAPGAWTYTGNAGQVTRRLSDSENVPVNTTADLAFGFVDDTGAPTAQGDLFTILDDLVTALGADDHAGITGTIDRLDRGRDAVLDQLAGIGATANRVESSIDRITAAQLTLRAELAEVEDADLEEAIMELRTEEVAYEATLAALGRSLPQTLVAFLR